MATIYQLKTFSDLYTAVLEELGIQSTDTTALNRIKRDLNSVYLEDICPNARWPWLRRSVDVEHDAFISTGTCTITTQSDTVTLSDAPAYSVKGYNFVLTNYNEVYKIKSHTAGSTTLVLETRYTGTSTTTGTFRIWSRFVPLPSNCKETVEVRQDFIAFPIEAVGYQDMQKIESMSPRAQGRPVKYCTGNYIDPIPYSSVSGLPASATRASSGLIRTIKFGSSLRTDTSDSSTLLLKVGDRINVTSAGSELYNHEAVISSISTTSNTDDTITFTAQSVLYETSTADTSIVVQKRNNEGAAERFRELILYPSAFDTRVTLHVDYIIDPPPMVEDDDEPLIPIGDRLCLFYGAAAKAWARYRKPDDYSRCKQEFVARLAFMKGKTEDSVELARLVPSREYLTAKRRGRGQTILSNVIDAFGGGGGGGGVSSFSGIANTAAIFNSVGDLTSSPSITTTELNYLDGITSGVVSKNDTQTITNKTLACASNSITSTANSVAIFDASGLLVGSSTITTTELGYLDGLTSAVVGVDDTQTLTNKTIACASNSITSTASRVATFDGSGLLVADSNITTTELGYLNGLTSNVVGVDDSQTLTNKTIACASNNITSTASRVATFDGSGLLTASSDVTTTELAALDVLTVSLADNQASAANVFTYSASTYTASVIDYSISRGAGNTEVGTLLVASDGTSVNMTRTASTLGTIGVTLSADISGGSIRIRYTSTSTGTAPSFNYLHKKWTA